LAIIAMFPLHRRRVPGADRISRAETSRHSSGYLGGWGTWLGYLASPAPYSRVHGPSVEQCALAHAAFDPIGPHVPLPICSRRPGGRAAQATGWCNLGPWRLRERTAGVYWRILLLGSRWVISVSEGAGDNVVQED